jgi:hypothetical protein
VYHNASTPAVGGPIGWRDGVAKFVVVLSDASPHGAGTAGIANCHDPSIDPLGYTTGATLGELGTSGRSLFMVLEPGVFDYLKRGDETVLEADALEDLARDGQLAAYRHGDFWQCMDTVRDLQVLQKLWESGHAPWRLWE